MDVTGLALERWCGDDARCWPSALVFAPHPDDEVVGLGAQLWSRGPRAHVAYVSDGAPENPAFFRELGFDARDQYALERRREALDALALAGIGEHQVHDLGGVDQAVARELSSITARAARLIATLAPQVVFAPPFEGGHPDHDATAVAVHAALRSLSRSMAVPPVLLEYTSYHRVGDALVFGRFLPHPGGAGRELVLDAIQRWAKSRMVACHATQTPVLRQFPLDLERVRVAPAYDFRQPPSAPFHYDTVDWGMRGRDVLDAAARTLGELGIDEPC